MVELVLECLRPGLLFAFSLPPFLPRAVIAPFPRCRVGFVVISHLSVAVLCSSKLIAQPLSPELGLLRRYLLTRLALLKGHA